MTAPSEQPESAPLPSAAPSAGSSVTPEPVAAAADAPVQSAFSGLKVMVIDDSRTIAKAAEQYLGGKEHPTGIVVRTCANAYDHIADVYEFRPDIIFLDVMMPKIDGFTFCRLLKSNPDLKHIRVVMLTSKDGLFDRAKAGNAGADGYITKPFKKEEILRMVSEQAVRRG